MPSNLINYLLRLANTAVVKKIASVQIGWSEDFFGLSWTLERPAGPPLWRHTARPQMATLLRLGEKIARRAVVNRGAVQSFARPFAANPLAVHADDDSFLKWTTPEPQQFVHAGILAAPETKVRFRHSDRLCDFQS